MQAQVAGERKANGKQALLEASGNCRRPAPETGHARDRNRLRTGCGGSGVARRIGSGQILAIDRSARAIAQAEAASRDEIAAGRLRLRRVAAEDFVLAPGEAPYDLAFAVRVGALDGRYPEAGEHVQRRIAAALKPGGRLFADGGDPLREVELRG